MATFTAYTRRNTTINIDINFNNDCIAEVGYGFQSKHVEIDEKHPMAIGKSRVFHSITPQQITKLVHNKSGRVFTIGKTDGFIYYETEVLENNKKVASIKWEDYYKD